MSAEPTDSALPIGVMIPTRNCLDRLRGHVAPMKQWIDLASEIIIVDSQSTDGTVDFLRSELNHPKLRIVDHPPGLYASWNFGIKQLAAKYCYIATAGDTISREGFRHLFEVAEKFQADVVLSKPMFTLPDGRELPRKRCTLDDVLDELKIHSPEPFSRGRFFLTSTLYGMGGVMGSSASNLYKTATMQARPFPLDFGHVGDTAWGVANGLETRAAVTPKTCASFLIHLNAGMVSEERERETELTLLRLARESLRRALSVKLLPPRAAAMPGILDEYEEIRRELNKATRSFDDLRARGKVWVLRPDAWRSRLRRNAQRQRLKQLWRHSLATFNF